MRLFGKVNSAVDRLDRAAWMTPPFDLFFGIPAPITAPPDPAQTAVKVQGADPTKTTVAQVGPDPDRTIARRI